MNENVRDAKEFLFEQGIKTLLEDREQRGSVLRRNGAKLQLRRESVDPLLGLMSDKQVTRLEDSNSPIQGWYLDSNRNYRNRNLGKGNKRNVPPEGRIQELNNPGDIFFGQNTRKGINPFYNSNGPDDQQESGYVREKPQFSKESVLQQVLRYDIEQLELGLTVADGGAEQTVRSGRPDITARDGDGNLVAIELKKGAANSLTQLESYMVSIATPQGKVRGILVAHAFNNHVKVAAEDKPNIALKAYSIRLTFEDR